MAETIGYISVMRHAEHGYFGGYLILNYLARPLEFHCTMPVKPSRAQALLYGPTIDDFVCGEQISKALVEKAKLKPAIVLTNCAPVLSLSLVSSVAVVMLQSAKSEMSNAALATQEMSIGDHDFLVPRETQFDREALQQLLAQLSPNFEIAEPFQRITEALWEAHPIAKVA